MRQLVMSFSVEVICMASLMPWASSSLSIILALSLSITWFSWMELSVSHCFLLSIVNTALLPTFFPCSLTLIFSFLLVSPACFVSQHSQSMMQTPSFQSAFYLGWTSRLFSVVRGFMNDFHDTSLLEDSGHLLKKTINIKELSFKGVT